MREFRYESVTDPADAVALLTARPESKPLAGGTNLVDLMKLGVERPESLVDVQRLGLDGIEPAPGGGLLVGAGVRNSVLAADPGVRAQFPVLSQALLSGASGQLRNRATTAGNLLQRTRCLYFQDVSKPCNKRVPGSGCPAVEGEHHGLAILGGSDRCVATHPSDMAVAMTALGAVVHLLGPDGTRDVALDDLYVLPGDDPSVETTLRRGELITGVRLPPLPDGARSSYRKVRERASYAFALVSVAAAVTVVDGVLTDVRLGLGGVAPTPWRAHVAERALTGAAPSVSGFRDALDAELAAARPLRDNAFKVGLVRRTAVAVLADLADLAGVTG